MVRCAATTRAGTPCQQPAGWGTGHVGTGRCKLHGGNAGAPRGNKNRWTHGGYSLALDALTDDEAAVHAAVDPAVGHQWDETIRLCEVRLRRLLIYARDTLNGQVSKDLEGAISRVQAEKARALEGKQRAASGGSDSAGLDAFLSALDGLR